MQIIWETGFQLRRNGTMLLQRIFPEWNLPNLPSITRRHPCFRPDTFYLFTNWVPPEELLCSWTETERMWRSGAGMNQLSLAGRKTNWALFHLLLLLGCFNSAVGIDQQLLISHSPLNFRFYLPCESRSTTNITVSGFWEVYPNCRGSAVWLT